MREDPELDNKYEIRSEFCCFTLANFRDREIVLTPTSHPTLSLP